MTIEMLTLARGAVNACPGQIIDLPDDQAIELVAGGYAKDLSDGPNGDADDQPKPAKRRKDSGAPSRE